MWNTLEEARAVWRDAPANDETLTLYLESAHSACLAFAPALPEPEEGEEPVIPEAYKLAEIQQARNLFNATKASAGGDFDGSSYGIVARPLDWHVQQLLRPKRAVRAIA